MVVIFIYCYFRIKWYKNNNNWCENNTYLFIFEIKIDTKNENKEKKLTYASQTDT